MRKYKLDIDSTVLSGGNHRNFNRLAKNNIEFAGFPAFDIVVALYDSKKNIPFYSPCQFYGVADYRNGAARNNIDCDGYDKVGNRIEGKSKGRITFNVSTEEANYDAIKAKAEEEIITACNNAISDKCTSFWLEVMCGSSAIIAEFEGENGDGLKAEIAENIGSILDVSYTNLYKNVKEEWTLFKEEQNNG